MLRSRRLALGDEQKLSTERQAGEYTTPFVNGLQRALQPPVSSCYINIGSHDAVR